MITDQRITLISIDISESITSAFKKMSEMGKRLFLVFDNNLFVGVLSIGDIQRAIIKGMSMDAPISEIIRKNFKFAKTTQSNEEIKDIMLSYRMEFMPVLDSEGKLVRVIFWEDIIKERYTFCTEPFDLPVVIMAGGRGTRLKPLTNILPKPLIPINEKTIIEDIMDKFVECGSHRFFISVNYKADFIRSYFDQLANDNYQVSYFQEEKPLGTAGSLTLLKNKINSTFFVSNCDIIIEEDYSQILKYHRDNNNQLTLITALKSYSIPYGVVSTLENGLLTSLSEKPEISFQINTGVYILEPSLLDIIPEGEFFHITQLMDKIVKMGGRVGCFPISEKSWTDIGEWSEYCKLIK